MQKIGEMSVRDVVERLEQMSELPLEECLKEIGECAKSGKLDERFFGVIAMSDRILVEFGIALDSQAPGDTAGLAASILVLLDDVVKKYLGFTLEVMAQNGSSESKARDFPYLSLLHSLQPWLQNVLPSQENDDCEES